MAQDDVARTEQGLVTVVMNCFNGERYLRDAIDSVVAQSYTKWEIVFWDNVSTDSSAAIARAYEPKLRYFRAAHQTPLGAARNLAVEQAHGEFITFLDCDDLLLSDALERHIRILSGSCAVSYGGIIRIDQNGNEIGRAIPPARSGMLLDPLLRQFDIYPPAVMVRRAALEQAGLSFDPAVVASEEYCLFMQLAADYPFCSASEPRAKYRIHEDSLTNKSIAQWGDERDYTLDAIERGHPGIAQQYAAGFREARARARYYRARLHMSRGNPAAAREELRRVALIGPRYFALFLISLLPAPAWDAVHRLATRRSAFS